MPIVRHLAIFALTNTHYKSCRVVSGLLFISKLDFCSVIQRRARVSSELLVVVFRLRFASPWPVVLHREEINTKSPRSHHLDIVPTIENQRLCSRSHWGHAEH